MTLDLRWISGAIQLVSIPADGGATTAAWFGVDHEGAARWAAGRNAAGDNVYYTANETKAALRRKPTKSDITKARYFWVDIDDIGAYERLAAASPSVIVFSGGGFQGLWRISGECSLGECEEVNRRLAAALGGDHCWSGEHLLRAPGTTNIPGKLKRARGRVEIEAELMHVSDVAYEAHTMLAWLPPVPAALVDEQEDSAEVIDWEPLLVEDLDPKPEPWLLTTMQRVPVKGVEDRSAHVATVATALARSGYSKETIVSLLMTPENEGLHEHIADQKSPYRAAVRKAVMAWKHRPKPEQAFSGDVMLPADVRIGEPKDAVPLPEGWTGDLAKVVAYEHLINDYAYHPGEHKVWPLSAQTRNEGLRVESFKMRFKPMGSVMLSGQIASTPITGLWERSPFRKTVARVDYRPDREFPLFKEGGVDVLNIYRPERHERGRGQVETFHTFIEHLIPELEERTWFLQWLAHKWRFPHIPAQGVILVADGVFGTGRGRLFKVLERLYGERHVVNISFDRLIGKGAQGQYNDWMTESLLVCIDEAQDVTDAHAAGWKVAANAYEVLKQRIDPAARRVQVTRKGVANDTGWTFCSYIVATNHASALAIPKEDRRLAVLRNGEKISTEMARRVEAWAEDGRNIGALADYLESVSLAGFSPYETPLHTEAKDEMVEVARSMLERAIDDVIEELPGKAFFASQVVARLPLELRATLGLQEAAIRVVRQRSARLGGHDGALGRIHNAAGKKEYVLARNAHVAGWLRRYDVARVKMELKANDVPSFTT